MEFWYEIGISEMMFRGVWRFGDVIIIEWRTERNE